MAICGAKTRNGEACQKPPMKGKRKCRLHGGATKNSGAPKTNKNAVKPGSLYSQFMTKDEIDFLQNAELGKIDAELLLCKVQLKRALEAKAKQAVEVESVEDLLELESIQTDDSEKGGTKSTFKYRDYDARIDRLMGRIQSLTTQRNSLVQQELDIELKRIELKERKNVDGDKDNDPTPVKVTINVVNASKENA